MSEELILDTFQYGTTNLLNHTGCQLTAAAL